jgi:hypothetical protein
MNAPRFTRRNFTAGLGGIVLSFSHAPRLALAQGEAIAAAWFPEFQAAAKAGWAEGDLSPL